MALIAPGELRFIAGGRVALSALGAGTASLGDAFGKVKEDTASSVLRACIAEGVSYIDTAPLYGMGLAERRLGAALRDLGQPRLTLSTKVGRTLDEQAPRGFRFDFSRDAILRGLEASLERLGRDHVEVVYLHDPDEYEDEIYREAWPTLESLRAQGVIGAVGVGMNQWQLPLRLVERLDLDVVLLAGRYTLLDQSAADTFMPTCVQRGVAIVLAGVFNSGVLVNPVDGAWYDYEPASEGLLARARAIRDRANAHGISLPGLALRFAAAHPAVASVLVGVGSGRELAQNAAELWRPYPDRLIAELRDEGIIRPRQPRDDG